MQDKTVTDLLSEIMSEFCDKYCKYPGICQEERKDPDEAENLLYDTYCANCPITRV